MKEDTTKETGRKWEGKNGLWELFVRIGFSVGIL